MGGTFGDRVEKDGDGKTDGEVRGTATEPTATEPRAVVPAAAERAVTVPGSATTDAQPLFDSALFMERMLQDPEFAVEILDAFLRDNEPHLQRLCTAIEQADIDTAVRCAHRIKGSAANVAALDLMQRAAALEKTLRAADIAAARCSIGAVTDCYAASKQLLLQEMRRLQTGPATGE